MLLDSVNLVKEQTLLLLSKLSKRQTISYLLNCTIIYQFIFPLATKAVTLTGSCTQFSKVWQRTTSSSCFQLDWEGLQCKKEQRSQEQLQGAKRDRVQGSVFCTFVFAFILLFSRLSPRISSIFCASCVYLSQKISPVTKKSKSSYKLL